MWQGNSALFEVGLCVMAYLMVLYTEFVPVVCERFAEDRRRPRLAGFCRGLGGLLARLMPFVLALGVAISCLHQSSLGHIFVLAPTKLHPLWWSPALALLFLLSAIVTGLPTVIFVSLWAAKLARTRAPMAALARLATFVPVSLAIYLTAKLSDMVIRRSYVHLLDGNLQAAAWLCEVGLGVVIPLLLLLPARLRESPRGLMAATGLVMLGIVLNRSNVYWIGYQPPGATAMYWPSLAEWLFTIGILAMIVLAWRFIAINYPVLTPVAARRSQ
jgi:Ni/Fe-hydrogenase subunit HybB-like protein